MEVEDGIDVDGAGFAAAVESTLGDPRSWGNGGRMSFQRVGAAEALAGAFDFKVSLVSPGHMETYCPGVGTGGYTSCRYGDRAVINLARWATAVPDYQGDIATYRQYVINHEVGHVLGNGHQPCPGPGQLAPVMQQQTLGLQGCAKNAWPYPYERYRPPARGGLPSLPVRREVWSAVAFPAAIGAPCPPPPRCRPTG